MARTLNSMIAAAFGCAALAVGALAYADGMPETPRRPPQKEEPVRAAPLPPSQPPAAETPPAATETPPAAEPAAATGPQTGTFQLANGAVTVTTPTGFEFWPAGQATAYLQRAQAPAPSGEVLGMIAPAGTQPTNANFWGTVVSYDPVGYVPADTANTLQAASLEADVRAARESASRPFVSFIAQPAFDAAGGSLSWSERTAAQAGANVRDLRHEQRVLGRAGVISLTTIARTDQEGAVVSAAPAMLQAATFPDGQRYANYDAAADNKSGYTLGDLVKGSPSVTAEAAAATGAANKAAGKTGGAGSGLQGWFPWIAVGVVALAAIGWFAMGRRNRDLDDDEDEDEDVEEEKPIVAKKEDEPKPASDPPPATA